MWPGNLRSCCDVATLLCYVTLKYNNSDPECPGRQVRRAAAVARGQRTRLRGQGCGLSDSEKGTGWAQEQVKSCGG